MEGFTLGWEDGCVEGCALGWDDGVDSLKTEYGCANPRSMGTGRSERADEKKNRAITTIAKNVIQLLIGF